MNQIVCQRHNLPLSQIIISADKAKLICEECYVNLVDSNKTTTDETILYLRKALNCPAYLLSKTNIKQYFPNFFENLQKFDEYELKTQAVQLEKKIRSIQSQLEQVVQEIKSYVQFIIPYRLEILGKLKEIINFEQVQQLIGDLSKQNDNMNPDIIEQIEGKLYQYFNNMKKGNDDNIIKKINQVIEAQIKQSEEQPKIQSPVMYIQFNNQVKEFNQHHQAFFQQTKPASQQYLRIFHNSSLVSLEFYPKLQNIIEQKSNKKIKQSNLIYLGTQDGLNNISFWNKINGKGNLIIIFKQKDNNHVFGAFSPCVWQEHQGRWVEDPSLASFLFSQTKNQIYPLKQNEKQHAIYCDQSYGPTFGGGYDLSIEANFNGGRSNFNSYSTEQYYIQQNHLLGGVKPNIAECEIYEIIFTE